MQGLLTGGWQATVPLTCFLLALFMQACGVNFLPMEQRMTRDLDAWKEEHHWHEHHGRRRSTAEKQDGVFAKGEVDGMSRGAHAVDHDDDELSGLCSEPAAKHLLVRSNSVAY